MAVAFGGQPLAKPSTRYSANDRQMMASMAGLRIVTETQAKRNEGAWPNASRKYVCSAPDEGIKQPSST